MNLNRTIIGLLISLGLSPILAHSQNVASTQEQKARAPAAEPEGDHRHKAQVEQDRARFREAVQQFQSATRELGEAISLKKTFKVPADGIEGSTKIILSHLKLLSETRGTFNASEFKNHTASELSWECLTTAERVTPALSAMVAQESQGSVDIRFLNAIPQLESELLRLQWMTRRLK